MLEISATDLDAPGFLDVVRRVIHGAVVNTGAPEVRVVHIDDWFDSKWLAFSGKILGALGVAKDDLTVPPFHPNRVVDESSFVLDSRTGAYNRAREAVPPLHLTQRST